MPRVVRITKKWLEDQREKETDIQRLQKTIRRTCSPKKREQLIAELINRLAKGEE